MSDGSVVLDASAVLAMLNDEPGGEHVASMLPQASISAVNLSEVIALALGTAFHTGSVVKVTRY